MREHCRRIIMLTADAEAIREIALAQGAEAVFSKTVDICELSEYIYDKHFSFRRPPAPI